MKTGRHEPNAQGFLGTILARTPSTRVSLVELSIDFGLMQTIQGPPEGSDPDAFAAWQVRFWRDMGYDCMSANLDIVFARHLRTAEDTAPLSHGTRSWAEESRGPITSWEEFEQYPWPQVSPAAFRTLETIKRHLPEGMKVMATLPAGAFENLTSLMGFETFSYALADQPDLVAAIVQRIDEILCQAAETTAGMDWVGAQWINDDLGFKGGTLASPETLREYIFPTQRRLAAIAHRHGKPVFLHSCGKLDAIMDDLIDDIGIDAKHSFEHVIEPVWEAKCKWGSRVGLLGGVDMDVLARGTEEQVRAYTRRCIEECLPGRGWALGSGNTIANYIPLTNYLAMLDEGRAYGRYG